MAPALKELILTMGTGEVTGQERGWGWGSIFRTDPVGREATCGL